MEDPGDDLPALAARALGQGYDTPALRQLAGLDGQKHYDPVEVRRLFGLVLKETGIDAGDRDAVARELLDSYLEQMISGDIDPHVGAREIIWNIYHRMPWSSQNEKYAGDSMGLEKLYGLSDTCDELLNADRPWRQDKTNDELLQETKDRLVEEAKRYRQELGQEDT